MMVHAFMLWDYLVYVSGSGAHKLNGLEKFANLFSLTQQQAQTNEISTIRGRYRLSNDIKDFQKNTVSEILN